MTPLLQNTARLQRVRVRKTVLRKRRKNNMFKRIENWLRRIFADEVTTLKRYFSYEMSYLKASFAAEREKYIAEMRDTLAADLKQFRADLVNERLLVHTPPNWPGDNEGIARPDGHCRIDEETKKADDQLRHPRHKR
jgi:hypothetical protein